MTFYPFTLVAAGGGSVSTVSGGDTSIVATNPAGPAVSLVTGTLDVLAALHPAAAAVGLNGQKITGQANGTAATDSAAFGQIPLLDGNAADIAPPGTVLAGAVGKAADAGHVHPMVNEWTPADYGALGSVAPWEASGSASGALTAGTVYLIRYNVRYAHTVTNVLFRVATASAGASTGSFVGLYSSAGALLSGSADTGALAAGIKTVALTTPQALTAGTFVWIALVVNFATTQPSLNTFAAAAAGIVNWNLAAASLRCAVNGTLQTALPASIVPGSNITAGSTPLFYALT